MSKFEVLTAMAFAAFADAPVEVAVVEVGMGGRWDATNVINAPVAVITPISIDHVDYLGRRHRRHRRREGGHHHQGPRGRTGHGRGHRRVRLPEAMEVLLDAAVRADAAVAREDSEFAVLARQVAVGGQVLQLQGLGGVYSELFLPLHGEHQAHNAALALAAVEAFFGAGAQRQLDVDAVRAGFAAVNSPGRLERVRSAPTVFIDAAHNPAGAAALAQTLADEFDFRMLVGVLSVLADKDVDGILAALEPVFDSRRRDPQRVAAGPGCRVAGVDGARAVRRRPGDHRRESARRHRHRDRAGRRRGLSEGILRHRDRHHRLGGHRRGRPYPVRS